MQKLTEDLWEGLEMPLPVLPSTCGLSVPISKAPGIDGESSQCWGLNPGPWHAGTPHYDPLNTHYPLIVFFFFFALFTFKLEINFMFG